uniref:Uncharacterized protein n=1 Tax=Arundo donax TaxID=35708 RepID=A0A0A8YBB3_ARUDO
MNSIQDRTNTIYFVLGAICIYSLQ